MSIHYDTIRHHLTATDRRAIKAGMHALQTISCVGISTGRNRYTLERTAENAFMLTVQNGEGQYRIPFTLA